MTENKQDTSSAQGGPKRKSKEERIKDEVVKEILGLNEGLAGDAQKRPNLALLVIGEEENKFINSLEQEAVVIGIDTHSYKCPKDSEVDEIKAMIECLNDDALIDGIYFDMPLPESFDSEELLSLINPDKELNFVLDSVEGENSLKEALLFKEVLEKYKGQEKE